MWRLRRISNFSCSWEDQDTCGFGCGTGLLLDEMESLGDGVEIIEIPDSPGESRDKGKMQSGESDTFTSGACKTTDDIIDLTEMDLPDVCVVLDKVKKPNKGNTNAKSSKPKKPDMSAKKLLDKLEELNATYNESVGDISEISMSLPSTPVVAEADDVLDIEGLPDLTGVPSSKKNESISQELVARYATPSTAKAYFKIFGNSKEEKQTDVGRAKLPRSKKVAVPKSVNAVPKNQVAHNNLRSPLSSLPVQLGTSTVRRKPVRRNPKARRSSFPMGPGVMPLSPIIDIGLDSAQMNLQSGIYALEPNQVSVSATAAIDYLTLNKAGHRIVMGKQKGWVPPGNQAGVRRFNMLVFYLNNLQKFFATNEALYSKVSCHLHSGSAQPPYHGLCTICGWPYHLERAFIDDKVQEKMAKRCKSHKKMMDLLKAPFGVQLVNQEWIYVDSFSMPWWKTFEVKECWDCGPVLECINEGNQFPPRLQL